MRNDRAVVEEIT